MTGLTPAPRDEGGSVQLRLYRIARRDGADRSNAARLSGIGLSEARFIDADDARNPPGPGAYALTPRMANHSLGVCATCLHAICGCSDAAWLGMLSHTPTLRPLTAVACPGMGA